MFNPLYKLLFIITLLISFVGQTMPSHLVSSFEGLADTQTKVQQQILVKENVKENSHTLKDIKPQSDDDCCEVECCENECVCPTNTCASIVYLSTHLSLSELIALSELLLSATTEGTRFIATSLYRPPIFTS